MLAHDSPIHSLQQLKDLLDAGALTRQEFELLKQKLISSLLGDQETQALENQIFLRQGPPPGQDTSSGTLTTYELVEEPEGETFPGADEDPAKLDVDHLLAPPEKNQDLAPEQDSFGSVSFSPIEEPDRHGESPAKPAFPRFEPDKVVNFADFSPLRGREPRPRLFGRGNLLNVVLVVSIISLAAFGAYVYFAQQKWESEQIASRQTQTAGGLAATREAAELFPVTGALQEAPGKQAPAGAAQASAPSAGPAVKQKETVEEPAPPAGRRAPEPAEPAADPAPPEAEPAAGEEADEATESHEEPEVEEARPAPVPQAPETPPASLPQDSTAGEEGMGADQSPGSPSSAQPQQLEELIGRKAKLGKEQ